MRSALATLLLVAGCEFRPLPLTVDAAVARDARRDLGSTPITVGGCDPVAQACGAGQRCALDCDRLVYACVPRHMEAKGTQGSVCSHDEDCVPGFVCVSRSGATRCAKHCNGNRDCERGTSCTSLPLRCEHGGVVQRRVCL